MKWISGKKTYIVAGIMAVMAVLKIFGVVDSVTYESLMGLLAALGFGALRAGVESVTKELGG